MRQYSCLKISIKRLEIHLKKTMFDRFLKRNINV